MRKHRLGWMALAALGCAASSVAQQASDPGEERASMRVHRNLAYAEAPGFDPNLTSLDLYAPASGSGHPIVIFVHGGGWKRGDKGNVRLKPKFFTGERFLYVTVNYRLRPAVRYRTQAGDVARAIAWVHAHGAEYGGDPERIFLMGHSAGAHLAALVAIDERYLEAAGLGTDAIDACVLLDGAGYDIPRLVNGLARPVSKSLYLDVFGPAHESMADASPITHVAEGKSISPFLIIHIASRPTSRLQSNLLAKALREAGVRARVESAEGKTHASLNRELGLPDDRPTEQVLEFLRANGAE